MLVPENMELRKVNLDDHSWLLDLHNDPFVLRNLTNPLPITEHDHLKWWVKIITNEEQNRLIFTVDGQRVGFTKFYDFDFINQNCVLGADIHKDFRGRGYAKFMWQLMLRVCFEKRHLHRVSLTTAEYNEIGQRVYRGLGFKEEGRLTQSLFRDGKYHDQICMFLLHEDWQAS